MTYRSKIRTEVNLQKSVEKNINPTYSTYGLCCGNREPEKDLETISGQFCHEKQKFIKLFGDNFLSIVFVKINSTFNLILGQPFSFGHDEPWTYQLVLKLSGHFCYLSHYLYLNWEISERIIITFFITFSDFQYEFLRGSVRGQVTWSPHFVKTPNLWKIRNTYKAQLWWIPTSWPSNMTESKFIQRMPKPPHRIVNRSS